MKKNIIANIKKEPLRSTTLTQNKKKPSVLNQPHQHSARLQTKTTITDTKLTKTLTWKNQKIDPLATFPMSLHNKYKVSKGNSPTNINTTIKKPLQKLQSESSIIIQSNENNSPLNSIYKRPPTSLDHHDKKSCFNEDTPLSKDIFLKHLLTLFDNLKPNNIPSSLQSNDIIINDIKSQSPLQYKPYQKIINSMSFEELTNQLNNINNNEQQLSTNKRKATYMTFFDFLFQLLEDIKLLCTQDIIIPKQINSNNDNNTNLNLLCDIEESQLQERSNIIEPVGHNIKEVLIDECIQSMLISSIYSDFYQDIIKSSPKENKDEKDNKLQSNNNVILTKQKISLSNVIKENIALTKHLKETQARIMNKHKRNDDKPIMIKQKTSHHISNDSTIKMNDNEYIPSEESLDSNNNSIDDNLQAYVILNKKPEHKHTLSIPNPKKNDEKCVIM